MPGGTRVAPCGICPSWLYVFTFGSSPDAPVYVGCTVRKIGARVEEHVQSMIEGTHCNPAVMEAFRACGGAVRISVKPYRDLPKPELLERERLLIEHYVKLGRRVLNQHKLPAAAA